MIWWNKRNDHDDLIYYFKNNTSKMFNDFDDGIEIF